MAAECHPHLGFIRIVVAIRDDLQVGWTAVLPCVLLIFALFSEGGFAGFANHSGRRLTIFSLRACDFHGRILRAISKSIVF